MLSDEQKKIHMAIGFFIRHRGYSPTYQELAGEVGLGSKQLIRYHLTQLRDAGFVTWDDGKPRTLRITRDI